jgi:hypothetical protein
MLAFLPILPGEEAVGRPWSIEHGVHGDDIAGNRRMV